MEDTDSTQQEPNNWPLPWAVADAAERGDLQAVKAWLARPFSRIDAMDNLSSGLFSITRVWQIR